MLSRARSDYSEGEYRRSYDAYEELAYFVCSKKASEIIDADTLSRLKDEVSRGVAGFASCGNEAVYEKSCELMDLFRNEN
ncbi:MAG: hypothetical protein KBT05_03845 [Bacteroidales bacterium]|nr:hypothetical protein [Candidatus Cryptobacteroides caccocaballi]